jgi:hypothetical protein
VSATGARWGAFAALRPDLADAGRDLLYQHGVGLAFLATVRHDGGPRVHPICPVIDGDGLYAFLVPSPKRDDLRRDGRYAMHAFPADENEDACYLTGTAGSVTDPGTRSRLERRFAEERPQLASFDLADQDLFEFRIERCLITRTTGHGDPSPVHEVWRAQGSERAGSGSSRGSESQARKTDR